MLTLEANGDIISLAVLAGPYDSPVVFAGGSTTGKIYIWKNNVVENIFTPGRCADALKSFKLERTISAFDTDVKALAALPGDRLASGSTHTRIWNVNTGELELVCDHGGNVVMSLAALPNEILAVSSEKGFSLFDCRKPSTASSGETEPNSVPKHNLCGRLIRTYEQPLTAIVVWLPKNCLASSTEFSNSIFRHNLPSDYIMGKSEAKKFSDVNSFLPEEFVDAPDKTVKVSTIGKHNDTITCMIPLKNGFLASASSNSIKIWPTARPTYRWSFTCDGACETVQEHKNNFF